MHLGEMLREHGIEDEARWEEAVEDYLTAARFVAAIAQGAPGAWADRAACRGHTDVMFPTRGESTEPAKAICAACPVLHECSIWAAAVPGRQGGIIAGLSELARRQVRRL